MSNSPKDDIAVLVGREFKRVKNGLDETQVASFITELIKERDKLAQTQEHMTSLNRLAERVVVEADKLAMQIKTEAVEQAKAESAAITDKAKEQARQIAERKIAEAVQLANEKADAIKARAEEEAAILLQNEKTRIRNELRNLVNEQFGYMLEELERLKQKAAAVQTDFGNKLSEPSEKNSLITVGILESRDAAAAIGVQDSQAIATEEATKTIGEYVQPSRLMASAERDLELLNQLQTEDQPESVKPQWEVEVLPPFEIAQIMEVMSLFDQLPEVANTEMIVPQIDVPLILVFLRKPLNVVDVLQKIPAVTYVEKVAFDKAATNRTPRRVRISLLKDRKL